MAVQISGNDITVPRDGSFTRNVTIGGTLTYEDVTNIDSVGLVTARTGIEIGARPGVAASISVDGNAIFSGITTFGGSGTGGSGTSILTYDGNNLSQSIDAAAEGIQITGSGAHYGEIKIDSNRTGANQHVGTIKGAWNGTQIARIDFNTGTDTSNKDDGQILFDTSSSGGTLVNRARIKEDGSIQLTSENTTGWSLDAGDDSASYTAIDNHFPTTNRTLYINRETTHRSIAFWNKNGSDGYGFGLDNSGNFKVVYGTSERIRISTNGRLGIGENSPDAPLHISTPASTTCEIRLTANNTGSGAGDRGRFNVYSAKNDGTAFHAGYIDIDRSSTTTTNAQMTFNLNNGSGVTEHVRIEPTGRILAARNTSGDQGLVDPGVILDRQDTRVGTNSNTFNGVGIIKDSNGWGTALYIKRTSDGAGTGFFCEFAYDSLTTSGTTIGSIANNGNSNVSYNTSSDYRLKQDISSITDAISSLKKLTPRKFRWKNDLDLGYQDGFIAHEVQETGIFSHLVTGEKDGTEEAKNDPDTIIPAYQQMDYSKLTPTLVAAVQELSAEIESLKAEIAALKSN